SGEGTFSAFVQANPDLSRTDKRGLAANQFGRAVFKAPLIALAELGDNITLSLPDSLQVHCKIGHLNPQLTRRTQLVSTPGTSDHCFGRGAAVVNARAGNECSFYNCRSFPCTGELPRQRVSRLAGA